MCITYRLARDEDLEEVLALVRAATAHLDAQGIHQWDEFYPNRDILHKDIASRQMRAGLCAGRIAVIYVLNHDSEPEYADCAWTHPELAHLVLHRLCVHPDFQNRGFAGQALAHAEQEAFSLGARAVRLDAFSQNPAALRLYARHGYAVTGHIDDDVGRFHVMEKLLTPTPNASQEENPQ